MPFFTEIRCPTNGLKFASFPRWESYRYRLEDASEFPLPVAYAWCHRCERFVEAERLYTVDEIQGRIDELLATKHRWAEIDVQTAERFAELGRTLPDSLKCQSSHSMWNAALAWRHGRKSPPRCLECGSFFAIEVLPESEDVPHPAGKCTIRVSIGDHGVADLPDYTFFDAEGLRIGRMAHDEDLDEDLRNLTT